MPTVDTENCRVVEHKKIVRGNLRLENHHTRTGQACKHHVHARSYSYKARTRVPEWLLHQQKLEFICRASWNGARYWKAHSASTPMLSSPGDWKSLQCSNMAVTRGCSNTILTNWLSICRAVEIQRRSLTIRAISKEIFKIDQFQLQLVQCFVYFQIFIKFQHIFAFSNFFQRVSNTFQGGDQGRKILLHIPCGTLSVTINIAING